MNLRSTLRSRFGVEAKDSIISSQVGNLDLKDGLWKHLVECDGKNYLMCCAIMNDDDHEAIRPDGLVEGHAYTLIGCGLACLKGGGKVRLMCLRNPWGDGCEWKGRWSDRDKRNWAKVKHFNMISFVKGRSISTFQQEVGTVHDFFSHKLFDSLGKMNPVPHFCENTMFWLGGDSRWSSGWRHRVVWTATRVDSGV